MPVRPRPEVQTTLRVRNFSDWLSEDRASTAQRIPARVHD